MTPTPTTGDIWQYHRFKSVEPTTVLLGKQLQLVYGDPANALRFAVVGLDFPSIKEISFRPSDMKHWRKVA